MLLFLLASVAAHAAVLAPLSGFLPALQDNRDVDSNTVIVSISISSAPAKPDEAGRDGGDAFRPLDEPIHPRKPVKRREIQADPALAISSAAPKPVESPPREAVVAQLVPIEKRPPADREAAAEPAQETASSSAEAPSTSIQNQASSESVARRRRQVRAEEQYLAELLNAISKHRSYPMSARRKGYQGQVEIDLTILNNGEFESISIGRPSDHGSLDKASTRALSRLKRFKPFPVDIQRKVWHISIPFRYVLNADPGNNS